MYTLHMYTCTHVHLYTCILFTHCTILSVNHLRPFNLISKFITTFVKSPYNAHTPVSISISVFRYSLSWSIIPSRYNSVLIPLYFRYISVIFPLYFRYNFRYSNYCSSLEDKDIYFNLATKF